MDFNLADLPLDSILYDPDSIFQQIDEEIALKEKEDILYSRTVCGIKNWLPNPKQLEFFATGLVAKERALFAANKLGKSLCACLEVKNHLTLYYPEWWNGYVYDESLNIWVAGVTISTTNLSLKKYFFGDRNNLGLIHPDLIVGEKKKDNTYLIRNKLGGVSTLTFRSHDQDREKFQADNVHIVYLDEQYPYSIHSECVARTAEIRKGFHGQVISTFSPLKGTTLTTLHFTQSSDLDEEGVRNIAPGEVHNEIVYINATLDDALHIPEKEKNRLIASYAPHERDARVKGIPSLGSGLIYPINHSQITCNAFNINQYDYWPKGFALDIGFDPCPTAAIFIAYDPDNDHTYVYGEYSARRLTPQHHAFELMKQGAALMKYAYDTSGNACSPTDGLKVIDLYKQAGLRHAIPADKRSVNKGLHEVLSLMENGKLTIFNTCKKLLTELLSYARDEQGKIVKGNDDLCDAMRYAIDTLLPQIRRSPNRMKKPVINHYYSSKDFGMRV